MLDPLASYGGRAKPGVNGTPSPFVMWVTAKAEKARRREPSCRGGVVLQGEVSTPGTKLFKRFHTGLLFAKIFGPFTPPKVPWLQGEPD